jgi:glycosyltransferase involved in cell wall biosynthesis
MSPAPSVAVALCTFNGESFLAEQLESIAHQTRRPDRVVVRDDYSTDGTATVLEDFARRCELDVRITRNETRVGVTRNFERVLRDADADLIALCDQDDRWYPHKLATLCELLEGDSTAAAACGDLTCVDVAGNDLGSSVWQRLGFDEAHRGSMAHAGSFGPLLRANVIPGASLVIRSEYRDLVLPFPEHHFYDWWVVVLLQAVSHLAFAREPLQAYRFHAGNTVGLERPARSVGRAARTNRRRSRAAEAQFRHQLLERLMACQVSLAPPVQDLLGDWVAQAQFRAGLCPNPSRRIADVCRQFRRGSYGRYDNGAVSAVYDMLFG